LAANVNVNVIVNVSRRRGTWFVARRRGTWSVTRDACHDHDVRRAVVRAVGPRPTPHASRLLTPHAPRRRDTFTITFTFTFTANLAGVMNESVDGDARVASDRAGAGAPDITAHGA
jgi:hypothetical protein